MVKHNTQPKFVRRSGYHRRGGWRKGKTQPLAFSGTHRRGVRLGSGSPPSTDALLRAHRRLYYVSKQTKTKPSISPPKFIGVSKLPSGKFSVRFKGKHMGTYGSAVKAAYEFDCLVLAMREQAGPRGRRQRTNFAD